MTKRLSRIGRITAAGVVALLAVACGRREQAVPGASGVEGSRGAAKPSYVKDVSRIRAGYSEVQVPARMEARSELEIRFVATNTGDETWPANGDLPLRFGYHWANPTLRSDWQSLVWDDGMRAMLPADVPPGGTASMTLRVKAPATPHADYKLVIAPLLEGPQGGWTTTTPHVANVAVL